jgi:hypothetical protein
MEPGLYKFVQVNKGEIRFVESSLHGPRHIDLVNKGETATAAGLVSIFEGFWKFADRFSTSLRIGCTDSIIPILTGIIGKPYKEDIW